MTSDLTRKLYQLSVRARRMGIISSFRPNGDEWKITDQFFKRSMEKEEAKTWLQEKIEEDD